MNEDVLTFTGDTVKSLGDGRIGGYLVRFTDATEKDLSGEYFTAKTYYGGRDGDGIDCLFHHSQPIKGVDAEYTDHLFAPLKTRKDSVGIFAETVLNMADEYERKVAALVEQGKLGWSSGAAGHTVRKSADGEILRWILAEGSLTPTPCDSGNHGGIRPLKSVELTEAAYKDVMTTGDGYAPANSREPGMAPAPMREASGMPNAANDKMPAQDSGSVECPACHLHCHFDADHKECPYCGQTLSLSADGTPLDTPANANHQADEGMAGKSFGDELDAALAAVESCTTRAEKIHTIRVKSDRTLSAGTRQKIRDLSDQLVKLLAAIKPEDLDALNAEQTVISMAATEAQMAVWEAEQATANAELQAALDTLSEYGMAAY